MNEDNINEEIEMETYFTKEIQDTVRDMEQDEMYRELRNLENSRAWIAILKYNALRMNFSQNSLNSMDPFKDPTGIARNQGIMLGLSDLQNLVISLTLEARAKQKELQK